MKTPAWPYALAYDDPRHGSRNAYTYHKCRCPACTEVSRLAKKTGDAKRRERLVADPTLAPHGSTATYRNWGCRCEPCKGAQSAMMAVYWRGRGRRAVP